MNVRRGVEIGTRVVIDWEGPSRQPCPLCHRGMKDRTCGVTIESDGNGVAHCFRCGYIENVVGRHFKHRPGHERTRRPEAERHQTLSAQGRRLWESCVALEGAPLAYLKARRCVIPPVEGHLRCHPNLKHWPSGGAGPALVALVTGAITGEPMSLHRTWVQANGEKAALDPQRMLLANHAKAGGVVRLWPDEALTGGLGIAEGIETALSLAHAYAPVWAVLDAGNLASLPVLDGVQSLLIAADHDQAGVAAAQACGLRWAARGRAARIVMPPEPKSDLNDMARAA